jgi:hypothetical protein
MINPPQHTPPWMVVKRNGGRMAAAEDLEQDPSFHGSLDDCLHCWHRDVMYETICQEAETDQEQHAQ